METVIAKDGTKIAYEKIGQGPVVILVSGALGTRNSQYGSQLAELMAPDFTVYY